jgi:hypothetical protein
MKPQIVTDEHGLSLFNLCLSVKTRSGTVSFFFKFILLDFLEECHTTAESAETPKIIEYIALAK